MGPAEVNSALHEIKYGKAILIIDTSEAGGFAEKLDYNPHELPNILCISTQNKDESAAIPFISTFVDYLDSGSSVEEAFEETSKKMYSIGVGNKIYRYHPGIHFGSPEDFTNPLVYLRKEG